MCSEELRERNLERASQEYVIVQLARQWKTSAAAIHVQLREKVQRYARVIGVQPASVNFKTLKSRCTLSLRRENSVHLENHHSA